MRLQSPHERLDRRVIALKSVLLAVWAAVSFGFCFFARELDLIVLGWPLNYWVAAQGGVLVFIAIVAVYAVVMDRLVPEDGEGTDDA